MLIEILFVTNILAHASTPNLVDIHEQDPSIQLEIRYFGSHNFVGRPITGYGAAKCLLSKPAADALIKVQAELRDYGMSLRVYDCYRPQRAVNDFVEWAKDIKDTKMKKEFYPKVDKSSLFKDGYIAEKSGHSRASTVDLTVDGLSMGTAYDFFDPLAHTGSPKIGLLQRKNRLLLKSVMEKFGFKNLPEEWWHYTLVDEPYPDQYFDIEIK